jgi:hypothetical protein
MNNCHDENKPDEDHQACRWIPRLHVRSNKMKEMEKMKNRTLTNSALALAGAATLLSGCTIAAPSAKQYKMTTTYPLTATSPAEAGEDRQCH